MRVIWCREIEDVINIARSQGWLFHHSVKGKDYYYVYAGTENELLCLVVEGREPLGGKYVTIDDDGKVVTSEKPIMPACARVISVTRDEGFEGLLRHS